jgi:hypothetical protein
VYVDADELPCVLRPGGLYTVMSRTVNAKIKLRRDGQTVQRFEAQGSKDDLAKLVAKLVEGIVNGVGTLESQDMR